MLNTRKVCLNDLNPHLTCVLCGGYFVDATTIIECLHSFCKTCIVRYLETSKYCPICDVQVHKTKPLQNIRSDQTLQDIVYKLVPGLFQKEMLLRRQFYAQHPEVPACSKEDAGEATDSYYFYSSEDQVSLVLQYTPAHQNSKEQCELGKRYLRCPAAVTVAHLQKLLRAKYDLSDEHQIEICHEKKTLSEEFSLMDVAYISKWKRECPMHLFYHIYERPSKRRKIDTESSATTTTSKIDEKVDSSRAENTESQSKNKVAIVDEGGEEWKEVQLQISENGIMKVDAPSVLSKEIIISSGRIDSPSPSKQIESADAKCEVSVEKPSSQEGSKPKVEKSDINGNKKDVDLNVTSSLPKVTSCSTTSVSTPPLLSPSSSSTISVPSKKAKLELSKEKIVNSNDLTNSLAVQTNDQVKLNCKEFKREPHPSLPIRSSPTPIVKKSVSTSVGYKTLKYSPKNWNPSFTKGYLTGHSTLSKSAPPVTNSKQDLEAKDASKPSTVPVSNKPPRFFKERDRPRFLGNPVSGVKPMYQIQSELTPRPNPVTPQASTTSMIKIDPKTLSPMTSKPPMITHNNNNLPCSVSSVTGTTTSASSRSKVILKNSTSMSPLPSIPDSQLVYHYADFMNAALIRNPLIPPNSPHPYSPFPLQPMFFGPCGPRQPRFKMSPPTVQRIPANVHSQMSPPPTSSVPASTISTPKVEITKVNGDLKEKSSKKEIETAVVKPQDTTEGSLPISGANSVKTVNKVSTNNTASSSIKSELESKDVNKDSNSVHSDDKSKPVPPASPAQHTK